MTDIKERWYIYIIGI